MSSTTVVWITGVGRGIGKALATAYLSRPNHTVIGSVRDSKAPKAEELKSLPTADGSKLLLVSIENSSYSDPATAVEEVKAAGINYIDIVIANSGVSPGGAPLDAVDPKLVLDTINVNAIATVVLYQAVHKLLTASASPKWITVSSRAGSIGDAADFYYYVAPYGMSKAAVDWFTSTLHMANKSLIAFAVHPGFVATDMGIEAATGAGIDMPATSSEESASKLMEMIDSATREKTSGKLLDSMTGHNYLW